MVTLRPKGGLPLILASATAELAVQVLLRMTINNDSGPSGNRAQRRLWAVIVRSSISSALLCSGAAPASRRRRRRRGARRTTNARSSSPASGRNGATRHEHRDQDQHRHQGHPAGADRRLGKADRGSAASVGRRLAQFRPRRLHGSGEGNRDQIVLRGNSSTADFFVDGVRDDVQYFRDFYNVDRVEVLKGPNAMIFGRGGGGGMVNRVLKRPSFAAIAQRHRFGRRPGRTPLHQRPRPAGVGAGRLARSTAFSRTATAFVATSI